MRLRELFEATGRVVKGVNTTQDVDTDEIKTQAAKWGFDVDKDGQPPVLGKKSRSTLSTGDLRKMKIRELDESIVKELRIEKPDEEDTFGIPRKEMPQIKEEDYPEFFAYLKDHGVSITDDTVPARSLKPIQKEFSDKGVVKALMLRKNDKPVIASSDNYIVDGHHRWLGAVNTRRPVSIIRADIPISKLLGLVKKFPKTYYKDIYDIKPVGETASAGATSAGAVASVANPPRRKKKKSQYNADGTMKNALDANDNVMGSKTLKR